MENGNKPISPLQHEGFPSSEQVINDDYLVGLTKREYFAAKLLQGILSCREIQITLIQDKITWEEFAVKKADDLLSELEKPKTS